MNTTDHWQSGDYVLPQSWQNTIPFPRHNLLGQKNERAHTFDALVHAQNKALQITSFQIQRDRYVIFSDLHKGDRQKDTDDFQSNERFYCHALDYYLNQDYRLVLNGDVEEGWKTRYSAILAAYESTAFEMERRFALRGKGYYLRIYGNHDIDWANPAKVNTYLKPIMNTPVQVYPAVMLGSRIMIAHGHQGDLHSDRRVWFSRPIVRHIWRPLQRRLQLKICSAAINNLTHRKRDQYLSEWARINRLLLIAGHTHRALFSPGSLNNHYLNEGCCVHTDGITGMEIDQGEIRLVKWSAAHRASGEITRSVLETGDLAGLLHAFNIRGPK